MSDVLVIGGGIVGLATALRISQRWPRLRLTVLEKEKELASHQTGHNSGVIHSGIYYRPGSLKAKLCVEGGNAMVAFCREHGIPHRVTGKMVVAASPDELPQLEALRARGAENGVPGLEIIERQRMLELEPHVGGIRALHVPTTGITDFAAVARKYAELLRAAGAEVRTGASALAIVRRQAEPVVQTTAGEFPAKLLINCAGLHSDRVARMAGARPPTIIVPFRGEYYEFVAEKRRLVRNLIYPLPDPRYPFLGVHITSHLDGSVTAGPNAVLAFKREGYSKSDIGLSDTAATISRPAFWRMTLRYWRSGAAEMYRSWSKAAFVRKLQRLLPDIESADLSPGKTGVRAQALDPDGRLADDFRIVEQEGAIHVLNVPSPAATASLAIGRVIAEMAAKQIPT